MYAACTRLAGGERTVFSEVEGADAVAASLVTLMPTFGDHLASAMSSTDGLGGHALEEMLRAAGARPFAEFVTVRTKFGLGTCSVDADVASFGHAGLEIERMCSSKEEVAAALVDIDATAQLIGAQPLSKASGGKLETFIRRHCPNMLKQLVQAGVLVRT